jgi:CheY-like chemotaxis protein/anti-sigma regulatory factor (Ser/Thr protein kinase)
VVLRNCQHLSSMIDDVLDLTRVESGKVMLHWERVHLHEIITEAVIAVRPLIEKKGLALQVTVPDDTPEIHCDRTRIRQVVLNLISNAARFTETGEIAVRVSVSDGYLVTEVRDTGPGISKDDIDRIFEPFSQSSGSMWRDKGGTGLGLSISQQFVAMHRGELWVESEPGVGSSFSFTLPITQPLEPIARPGHYNREDWIWREAAFRTEGARVAEQIRKPRMVVCDEVGSLYPELARYAAELDLIETSGACDQAGDTDSRAAMQTPADVVMLNTPLGTEPGDALAALEGLQEGTVVVQCAVPAGAARAAAAGASGYLNKPVSYDMLRETLQNTGRQVQRILLVDDDVDILRLFARMLSLIDPLLVIETADRGQTALEKVRAESFDLVLLDLVMPDMDGWTWLQRVRQDTPIEELPVYLVSAQDPANEPPASPYLLATMSGGISIKRLLRCSLELSRLFLEPEGELDPMPRQIRRDESV